MAFQVKDLMITLEPSRHACPTASADTQCPTASATIPWRLSCPGQSQNQGGCPTPSFFDGPARVETPRSLLRRQLAERLN